jgi:cyanophycin synthetase
MRATLGARGRLVEPTFTCTVKVTGNLARAEKLHQQLRPLVPTLWPSQPILEAPPEVWPQHFIVSDQAAGDKRVAPPNNAAIDALWALGEWLVALTVGLQRTAYESTYQGQVLAVEQNKVSIAVPWTNVGTVKESLRWAARHLIAWMFDGEPAEARSWHDEFKEWLKNAQKRGNNIITQGFIMAARQRQIPVTRLSPDAFQLGWGSAQLHWEGSCFQDSMVAGRMANFKHLSTQRLEQVNIPVPSTHVVTTAKAAERAAKALGYPVVVKPLNNDRGEGVFSNLYSSAELISAFKKAAEFSQNIIVQRHVEGEDYRLLVVNGKCLVVTRRDPAAVVGDGEHTIRELVDIANQDPRRGDSSRSYLIKLALDDISLDVLAQQGFEADAIPACGEKVLLRQIANFSTGGTVEDVTERVHPDNALLAVRAARAIGLSIAGVDLLISDIERSWREVDGHIIEVNGGPGLRLHWLGNPTRDLNGEILDQSLGKHQLRIPTAAVLGVTRDGWENPAARICRMLHHLFVANDGCPGTTTSQGVFINSEQISAKSAIASGKVPAALCDATVDTAFFELWPKLLDKYGHFCDRYDVLALYETDALLSNDVTELSNAVTDCLTRAGHSAVINADSEDVLALCKYVPAGCQSVLVSMAADNPALVAHRAKGGEGLTITLHQGARWIVACQGSHEKPLLSVNVLGYLSDALGETGLREAMFALAIAHAHGMRWENLIMPMVSFPLEAALTHQHKAQ